MTITESDLPGVGKKFEIELGGGEEMIVVIHNTGKREVFRRRDPDADSEKAFAFDDDLARKIGSIIEGAYFQPVELDEVEVPLGEAIIEWHEVDPDSELAGVSLETASVRARTGASVVAIQRGEETIANPTPETRIEPGDTVVALGTREEQSNLTDLIADEG
jgi:TrkA domain protein